MLLGAWKQRVSKHLSFNNNPFASICTTYQLLERKGGLAAAAAAYVERADEKRCNTSLVVFVVKYFPIYAIQSFGWWPLITKRKRGVCYVEYMYYNSYTAETGGQS